MRKRIIACLVGAALGALVFPPVRDMLSIGTVKAAVLCVGAGLLLGYIGSAAWDVMAMGTDSSQ
jgi:hypothetical protein